MTTKKKFSWLWLLLPVVVAIAVYMIIKKKRAVVPPMINISKQAAKQMAAQTV